MIPARSAHANVAKTPADEFASQAGNPDFVLSLARGLRVIECFEGHHNGRSITEVSQSTGLSRASIRRILLTSNSSGTSNAAARSTD
jgi:IclR family pca regulon transcriptional regulator